MDGGPETLASLRPARPGQIMDLVAEAGVDVSAWTTTQDGRAVKNPRSNPHYCYEWAFGGDAEPTVLCVWHNSLSEIDHTVTFVDNVRQYALRLDPLTFDRSKPPDVRSRARDQAKRARNFDSKLQRAYRAGQPVRVVLLEGEEREQGELGWDTSKVRFRSLDPEFWFVHTYAEDGGFRMVRGVPAVSRPDESPSQPAYIDQFELPEPTSRKETTGSAYPRSSEVRRAALIRAAGLCELCRDPGFEMADGAVYLETHHVFPLSEHGPDVEWNVVALCPNDHKRAHFAKERGELRSQLVNFLRTRYPAAMKALDGLAERRTDDAPKS